MSEFFSELDGALIVRDALDTAAERDQGDGLYDWDNLELWHPEHRWAVNNMETCMNVWKDMVLVANQVLKESD